MSDLIERQKAIDEVKDADVCVFYSDNQSIDDVIDYTIRATKGSVIASIEQMPTVQPEPQWVPCSERLPEKCGNYLISIHGEDEPDIGTINPNDKRGWSLCDANGFHWASDKKLIVTAWMPLPEPYGAERRTDDKTDKGSSC